MVRVLFPVAASAPTWVELDSERFHYLIRVLRLRTGDELEVFDGQGRSFPARITEIKSESAILELGAPSQDRRIRPISLVQGIPKAEKMDWILQKATELGAAAIVPALTKRTVVKVDEQRGFQKQRRWRRIAEEAARQCQRSDVPQVFPPKPLVDALQLLDPATRLLVLSEYETTRTLSQAFREIGEGRAPLALMIGPEGGFERSEIDDLTRRGALSATLGRRILRAETAGVAALSILLHLDGALG